MIVQLMQDDNEIAHQTQEKYAEQVTKFNSVTHLILSGQNTNKLCNIIKIILANPHINTKLAERSMTMLIPLDNPHNIKIPVLSSITNATYIKGIGSNVIGMMLNWVQENHRASKCMGINMKQTLIPCTDITQTQVELMLSKEVLLNVGPKAPVVNLSIGTPQLQNEISAYHSSTRENVC